MRLLLASVILVLVPATALCQAMLESAILSGATASAASGSAKATGDALSKSLQKLNSALAGAAATGAAATGAAANGAVSTPAIPFARTGSTPPLPKPSQTVFEGFEPGTPRADVIAKAGKPQSAIASSDDEMLKYATSEGGLVRIRVVDGKVSTIERTPPQTAPAPQPEPKAETEAAGIVSSGK